MGLEGKIVLITGGAWALGQTVVPALLSAGTRFISGVNRCPTTVRLRFTQGGEL